MQGAVARLAALAALAGMAIACGQRDPPATRPTPAPPCTGSPTGRVTLGHPGESGAPAAAHFTTTGGVLYVTAYNFDHSEILDFGYPGWTANSIGPADTPPSYDPQRSIVTPTTKGFSVEEDSWVEFEIPAGRYWLLTSNYVDIDIASCSPGSVAGQPAPTAPTLPRPRLANPPCPSPGHRSGSR